MWFYPVIIVLVILAVVGGALAGGVFTLVLIPLAAIALVSAIVYGMWGRATQSAEASSTTAARDPERPLPHRRRRPTGRAPSTPDRLVDARRQQQ